MAFHDYPYTDFHELNLDWVIKKVKELATAWAQVQQDWTDEQAAFANLQNWIENYFNNLNVQTEINLKLDAMVVAGTMSELIAPYVASGLPAEVASQLGDVVAAQIGAVVATQIGAVVADQLPAIAATAAATEVGTWLSTHIDPDTGYVIDDTLTVSLAAADAKTVGDKVTEIKSALSSLGFINYYDTDWTLDRIIGSNGAISTDNYHAITRSLTIDANNGGSLSYVGKIKDANGVYFALNVAYYTNSTIGTSSFVRRDILLLDGVVTDSVIPPTATNMVIIFGRKTDTEVEIAEADIQNCMVCYGSNYAIRKVTEIWNRINITDSNFYYTYARDFFWTLERVIQSNGAISTVATYAMSETFSVDTDSIGIAYKQKDANNNKFNVTVSYYTALPIGTGTFIKRDVISDKTIKVSTVPSNAQYYVICFGRNTDSGVNIAISDLDNLYVIKGSNIYLNYLNILNDSKADKDLQIDRESFQINDGLTQTSADGSGLAYNSKYGITYNVYMPGNRGSYGESRGRICLTYFPTTQPTNQKTIEVVSGNSVYNPNICMIGDTVRLYYLKNSGTRSSHIQCYKDFDIATETLGDEHNCKFVMGGESVDLTTLNVYSYLTSLGYTGMSTTSSEPMVLQCDIFTYGGKLYCDICNDSSYPVLVFSEDNGETWEPFAVYPILTQYEFAYTIKSDVIYALYRTSGNPPTGSIYYVRSDDMGLTWETAEVIPNSIQCRPRVITYKDGILFACNIYNNDYGYRPTVQQGRTEIRIWYNTGSTSTFSTFTEVFKAHSIYGIVNICLLSVFYDLYMSFSTSIQALDYQNGQSQVRGKDAIRFYKIGYVVP